jgi:ribonuclease BN (tRNA processing enzyme)
VFGHDPRAGQPGVVLPAEGRRFRLVVDIGSGALGALQRYTGLDQVDAVLLSHLHADHFIDMCSFWVARTYWSGDPLPRIPVYGPADTAQSSPTWTRTTTRP